MFLLGSFPGELRRATLTVAARLAVTMWLVVAGSANGHTPDGSLFRAFPFQASSAPVVDGDLTDWELVGPSHTLTAEAFHDLVDGPPTDDEDFSIEVKIGWCEDLNRLYFAAQVRDDLHQIDRPSGSAALMIFQDDDMEIFVDADHSGGQYAHFSDVSEEEGLRMNGAEASHFVIAGPHSDGEFFINFSAAAWYAVSDGPFTAAAFRLDGEVGGPAVMNYEFAIVPFDRIDISADFLSMPHDLTPGEILGINVEFNDFDSLSEVIDTKLSLSGGFNSPLLSDRFTDLFLDFMPGPTIVEDRSWGRIKASIGSSHSVGE